MILVKVYLQFQRLYQLLNLLFPISGIITNGLIMLIILKIRQGLTDTLVMPVDLHLLQGYCIIGNSQ